MESTNTPTDSPKVEQNDKPKEVVKPKPIVGVDFGTQKSVIAIQHSTAYDDVSLPYIAHNNLANDETPNIVAWKNNNRFIGEEGLNLYVSSPKTTVSQVKRFLGLNYSDPHLQNEMKRTSFAIKPTSSDKVTIEIPSKETFQFSAEQLSSMILHKLTEFAQAEIVKKNKENAEDVPVNQSEIQWAIAVPEAFSVNQKVALMNAAKIAGLNTLGLIHETTSAALTYGYLNNSKFAPTEENPAPKKTVLFVQIGHCYFNTSVVQFTSNKLQVLSRIADAELGGRFVDTAIYDHCVKEFQNKFKMDINSNQKAMNRLLRASEKCKHVLSTIPETDLIVECIMNDKDLSFKISRTLVEDLCKESLNNMATHLNKCVAEAGITLDHVDAIEVVGGGARLPIIQNKIKSTLNRDLGFSLDSAHCIAIGAALFGKSVHHDFGFSYEVVDKFMESVSTTIEDAELESIRKVNQNLLEQDQLIAKIRAKKNEIETYIYAKRSQCNEPSRDSLLNSTERSQILSFLQDAENWIGEISEEDATFENLDNYMNTLTNNVNTAGPKLHEQLVKEEEDRKKAAAEAEEYLKTYHPETKDREPRTNKEKLALALKKKNQGAICFKDGDFEQAANRWIQALATVEQLYEPTPEQKKEVEEIKLPCLLNCAACYLKLTKYERARDNCTEALKLDPNNAKALYRRGQAYYYLRALEEAKTDLMAASKLEPTNNEVKKILKTVQDQLVAQKEKEKKMYQKMFG